MELPEARLLIHISVEVDDLATYFAEFSQDIERRLPELHERFAETLAERAKKAFDEGGYPEKWVPSQRAIKKEGKTLIDTGRLMQSLIEYPSSEGFMQTSGESMVWGTNVPYGPFHWDERYKPKHLRKVIQFDDELNDSLEDDMNEWLEVIIDGLR